MKIRSGFVSNSSSTSFLVAINSANVDNSSCPTCGRSSDDVIDITQFFSLRNYNASDYDETRMVWDDEEGLNNYINNLKCQIDGYISELDYWKNMDDEDMSNISYCRNATPYEIETNEYLAKQYKVKDLRQWYNSYVESGISLLNKVLKAVTDGKRLIRFDVSYHDEMMNKIVARQIERKSIEVIEKID